MQCWDNSTRGLDSATALEFVKTLRISTEMSGATAIVAIYQASQSIYDIFDKVVVLYEGRQIYFGEKTAAKRYFIDMGFDCPTRQTTADFLTSITSPAERVARPGFETRVPHTPDEFAAAWQKSEDRAQLLREIDEFDRQYPIGGEQVEKFKVSRRGEPIRFFFSPQQRNSNSCLQPHKPKVNGLNPRTLSRYPCRLSCARIVDSRDYRAI